MRDEEDWPALLAEATRELRMPLHAVLGWVQLLRSGPLDGERKRTALETIERNARLQAQLLDDLLDLGRVAAGHLQLRVRSVDPGRAVAVAIDRVRPFAAERAVLVERTIDPHLGPAAADPDRLQQIVRVLLLAALRATPDRGVIEVHVERSAENIVVRVGRSPFELSVPSRRLVERLLELHQSHLELNGGAHFALPPARGPADESAPPLAGVRIVAVDDELDARELLRAIFEQHGAEVRTAGSAAEALPLVRSWQPEVLVSDIGMPDENGYALMKQVRALGQEGGGWLRALALTAHASDEDARLARHAGYDRHVSKPVDAAELVKHLLELLAR
ncbi:MAG: two-component sensor histidine kinase [Myxococcales bacterium]|nr:two-component sensor histidine kinase [Myxococcales bacterium]